MEIEKIYIINSGDTSMEAQDALVAKLAACDFHENTDFEIINTINISPGLPDGYAVSNLNDTLLGDLNMAVTHRTVWEKIVFDGKDLVLILNHDFLCKNSISKLQIPDDTTRWDLAILNRTDTTTNELVSVNDSWVRPQGISNIGAYVLHKSTTANMLLSGGLKQNLVPLDMYLSALTYPYMVNKDIQDLFPSAMEAIATKNPLFIGVESIIDASETTTQDPKEPYYEILDVSDWEAWKEKYINLSIAKGEYDLMVDDKGDNVYEFSLFTPKFCKEAIALAESKDKWTQDRHEFYPTNDVLLPELGLNDIYNKVLDEVVRPLSIHLWNLEGTSWDKFSNENFMARYTTNRQSHLSLHHDRSHLTLVIKMNDEFSGGGTWFPKYQKLINPEAVGTAALHPGMVTHRHGARPITAGKRYIIVSFIRMHDNP